MNVAERKGHACEITAKIIRYNRPEIMHLMILANILPIMIIRDEKGESFNSLVVLFFPFACHG